MPRPDGGRWFTTDDSSFVQTVFVNAAAAAIEGSMDALADDLRPGCGSHQSMTNIGAVQEVPEPVPIDTTGIGDRAIGWRYTVTVSGTTTEAGGGVVVAGGTATILHQLALDVDPHQLAPLARAFAVRANGGQASTLAPATAWRLERD